MRRAAAVVLAAGASTRMGRPKALIDWRGRTFVEHAIALAGACDPIVVVSGAVALPEACTRGATVVHNADWPAGQMSSLRCGLSVLPPDAAALVLTVDRPHIEPATVEALLQAWAAEPDAIWQPELRGKRGHPILVPPDVVRAMIDAPPSSTQREVLLAYAARRRVLPVADPAVLDNLDRPEDLVRIGDPEL